MALNFGKLDFSVSFNPTSAFPLDARSYFESLEAAEAAAATATEAGNKDSVYYYGQTIVVVENNLATLYIIQPGGSLSSIGNEQGETTSFSVDSKQFTFDENGALSLKGFGADVAGKVLTADTDGNLIWITPIDTYTKNEIDSKIAAAGNLKRLPVSSLDDIEPYIQQPDFNQYVFMVPNGLTEGDNKYNEYIIAETYDSVGEVIGKTIEKVGSWEVNLAEYAKKSDLDSYVKKDGESRLLTKDEADKLASINIEAEENYIKTTTSDFVVNEGELSLSKNFTDKVTNIEELLSEKVDKQEGYTLLSPTDQKKLNALKLDGTNLEISGRVKAENIDDLDTWISENAATHIINLDEGNLTSDLKNKINSSISKVDEQYFEIADDNVLTLKSTITDTLDSLDSTYVSIANFNTTVGDLENLLADQVNIVNEIADINSRLTWQQIEEE